MSRPAKRSLGRRLARPLPLGLAGLAGGPDEGAGLIGGLAAGALIGAAASAHAEPAYGYGYAPPPPPRAYGYAPAYDARPRVVYEEPVYETRRVIAYERVPVGYAPIRRRWDGPYGERW
ncbi:hypothetical protein [Methylobacterium hispanicum]|uniref:hypothetical protein n=1 Tax=Methylobacterium hispanicum TaxID=270350 RepID=UPI002F353957